jgi:LuxR family transcriptional regulator, maltose regulon positive regulatory protein
VSTPLLETKLYVPRSRRGLVPRARLSERLDRGTASMLVLVSAPAGFGKTTLLTEWLAARPAAPADERLAAWLSLDRADNDPASFWAYVIAALRTVASGVGESALALLDAPQPAPIETVLTTLLNNLGAVAGEIVLVLDDYHVIDAPRCRTVWRSCSTICHRACTWCSPAAPIRRCRWHGGERAVSWPRFARPSCASPLMRPRRTSTG